jgi:hypothetical protein
MHQWLRTDCLDALDSITGATLLVFAFRLVLAL